MAKLSDKQLEMLASFEDGNEPTDIADFNGTLGWHNRERCIESLHKRGMLDGDGLTDLGRTALLSQRQPVMS